MTSLKTVTIYSSDRHLFEFYWAAWSPNVCIVKVDITSGEMVWRAVQSTKSARDFWKRVASDDSCAINAPRRVDSYTDVLWDSEPLQWVRRELAQ